MTMIIFINIFPELQKRADRADQSVLFFLAGANFWEKHAKSRRKHAKTGENTQKQAKNRRLFGANVFGGKLVGAKFYAFCNYGQEVVHKVVGPKNVALPLSQVSKHHVLLIVNGGDHGRDASGASGASASPPI